MQTGLLCSVCSNKRKACTSRPGHHSLVSWALFLLYGSRKEFITVYHEHNQWKNIDYYTVMTMKADVIMTFPSKAKPEVL